jgi:deoxyribonuclease V
VKVPSTESRQPEDYFKAKDISEARQIQLALKDRVLLRPLKDPPRIVAGVDAIYVDGLAMGGISVMSYPDLVPLEERFSIQKIPFPYVPGLLSFREGPVILELLRGLSVRPHVLLLDGQGIAHPKQMGLATHVGVALDLATIGCAKSVLFGSFEEPKREKGAYTYITAQGQKLGAAVRSREGVRPIFVSPGHLMDVEGSIEVIMGCLTGYRVPEPLRRADRITRLIKATMRSIAIWP